MRGVRKGSCHVANEAGRRRVVACCVLEYDALEYAVLYWRTRRVMTVSLHLHSPAGYQVRPNHGPRFRALVKAICGEGGRERSGQTVLRPP